MASNPTPQSAPTSPSSGLPAVRVYPLAAAALLIGLGLGYFGIGSRIASNSPRVAPPAAKATMPAGHPMPTMEQMKAMADAKVAPLLEKQKSDPNNAALLNQIAGTYDATHQFKEASEYFRKSLELNPNDNSVRTALASDLYYSGDAENALAELQKVLKKDPKDVNALFNLGMIRFKSKNDAAGAVAVWQQLLKAHPDLDRRPIVEKMIAEAQQSTTAKK
jgi:cytochrome c-type biogenesis protein CcmH/NrfG